jgi:hypothetical protein
VFLCQLAGRGWFIACGHRITIYSQTFIFLKEVSFKYVYTTISSRIQEYLIKKGSRLGGRLEMEEPNGRC